MSADATLEARVSELQARMERLSTLPMKKQIIEGKRIVADLDRLAYDMWSTSTGPRADVEIMVRETQQAALRISAGLDNLIQVQATRREIRRRRRWSWVPCHTF